MNKPRVLFVDDEPQILSGLQRLLRRLGAEWEMSFAEGPEKALAQLAEHPFDVVISDMRMPGMDGAALLAEVGKRSPETVRVILSGYSDQELALRAVRCSHLFLNKPFDPVRLISLMMRLKLLLTLPIPEGQRKIMTSITSLPVEPTLYRRLLATLENADSSAEDVARIVVQDVSLSSKVLQLINSAYFGLPRQIANPKEAVKLLGLEIIKALVLGFGIFSQYEKGMRDDHAGLLRAISGSGLRVASMACCVARMLGGNRDAMDEAFLVGMLHNVGHLILTAHFPDRYPIAELLADTPSRTPERLEEETVGINHCLAGSFLMGLWGFSEAVVKAVAFHHAPERSPTPADPVLVALHVAIGLARDAHPLVTCSLNESYLKEVGVWDRMDAIRQGCRGETGCG